MRRRSTWLCIVSLLVMDFACPLSCSFQVPVGARQCLALKVSTAAKNEASNNIYHLRELLWRAKINPEQCRIEPLSGPGFCNALYKVQFGKTPVSERRTIYSYRRLCSTHHFIILRWLESSSRLLPYVEWEINITVSTGWRPHVGSAQNCLPPRTKES